MKKFVSGLIFILCAVAGAFGQSGNTTITANHIAYFGGTTVTGKFCVTPTDASGNPITIVTSLGQQVAPQQPLCFPITAGVLSNAVVPDTSMVQPVNACYNLTITNFYGAQVGVFPCIQPTTNTWSFDAYVPSSTPSIPALTLPQFQVNGVTNAVQGLVNFVGSGVTYGAGGAVNIATGSPSIANNTILGNMSGSTGVAAGLTVSQMHALLAGPYTFFTVGTSGVTANKIVSFDSSGHANVSAGTGWAGLAASSVASGGVVEVIRAGVGTCVFDAAAVIGNIAIPSTTTSGDCHDSGATSEQSIPSSTATVGVIESAASGAGITGTVRLHEPGSFGSNLSLGPIASEAVGQANISLGNAPTYYVDNVNGNDSNNGLTPATPFATIAHINTLTLSAGQTIAFKSGDVFYEELTVAQSGTAGAPITFTAYGNGAKPVISANSLTTGWASYSATVWRISATTNPGFPDFAGQPGIPVASAAAVTAPTDWYWDGATYLYVYSLVNPASTVEIEARASAITTSGASYVTVGGLELRGGADTLYCGVATACSNWTVTGNYFDSSYSTGIHFAFNTGVSTKSNVFSGNAFRGTGGTPISEGNGGAAQGLVVSYNTMNNVCQIYSSGSAENAFCDGVQLFSQTQADGGVYVGYNYVNGSGIPGGLTATQYGGGFHCDTNINCVMEHNVAINTSNSGLNMEKVLTGNMQYNLSVNAGQYQYTPGLDLTAGAGYNESNITAQFNTVTGTLQWWSCSGGQNSNTLTNQIFQYNICGGTPAGGQTLYWDSSYSGTGNTWTSNNFGAAASCFVNLSSTCYNTYGTVPSPVGTTVLQGAPVFTNASLNDFTQAASSPALGIGATPYQATVQPFIAPPPTAANTPPYDPYGAAYAAQFGSLQKANNLSDLTSPSTARTSLGLGSAAVAVAPANTTRTAHNFLTTYTSSSGAFGQAGIGADDASVGAYVAGAGSVNVMTATFSPVPTLITGLEVDVLPNLANTTTTPTLNVNGLGAATITKNGTAALVAGDLTTTAIAKFIYDGTHWQLQNPQTTPTATLPSIAAHTFLGNPTASSATAAASAIGAQDTAGGAYIAGAGSVNVMTATLSPAATSLVAGLEIDVLPNLANTTTTPTLNVNGLGAATITKNGTAALVAGDYTTTAVAKFIYDGTHWQLQNPQTTPTATLPSIAAHTFLGNSTASSATAAAAAIGAQDTAGGGYIAAAGSVNVLTATLSPAATSLATGLEINILPNLANTTTTPTLNVNGLGAKTITKNGAAALSIGDLSTTAIAKLIYDGTEWQLLNPQTILPGSIVATPTPLTAQSANVSFTAIYTTPAATHSYLFCGSVEVTQAATTSSAVPDIQIGYENTDSVIRVQNVGFSSGSTTNTTGFANGGCIPLFNVLASTAIDWSTIGYTSSGATPLQYRLIGTLQLLQ